MNHGTPKQSHWRYSWDRQRWYVISAARYKRIPLSGPSLRGLMALQGNPLVQLNQLAQTTAASLQQQAATANAMSASIFPFGGLSND